MKISHQTFLCTFMVMAASLWPGLAQPGHGCGVAPPPGAHVGIAGEEAVIVWNPKTHTEQFIRRAAFESQAPQFGFLVPTPTQPRLTENYSSIFRDLSQTYRPHFVPHPEHGLEFVSIMGFLFPTFAGSKDRAAAIRAASLPHVSVLDSEQVAGYDAVVLRADDPAALTEWLKAHGYEARPALTAWLQPYVARHWAVTAFKVANPNAGQSEISSATVQMSFTTDRPFYPYSEPADQRDGHQQTATRLLRIFCVSPMRMDGALDSAATRWPGRVRWAEALSPTMRDEALATGELFQYYPPTTLWLTTFEDKSSPRPGVADLYFSPSAQQTPVVPTVFWPQDRRFPIPIEFIIATVVFAVAQWRKRQEKQRRVAVSGVSPRAPSAGV